MIKHLAIVLALALCACATGGDQMRESIEADVATSEWTPPGHVSLDLRTGRYVLEPQPPRVPSGAPGPATRRGTVSSTDLARIRAAFDAALAQGLIEPACASGGPPPRIVISNAQTPMLVLASRRGTFAAPGNLGCWSEAADRLYDILEERFAPEARPPRHR